MKHFLRRLRPPHALYLALHIILFLLGMLIAREGTPMALGVGGSLIAAAITGWVVFAYVLLSQDLADRLNLLNRFGLRDAFESRSVRIRHEYSTRLANATTHIDILGFGQRALREDYAHEFKAWSERGEVRILLLDPEFPSKAKSYADQRDAEEGNCEKTIQNDVREFVRVCADLLRQPTKRFQVRLYRCLPSINLFRIDNELFWGPYLLGDQSRNLPTFLVESGGVLFDRLLKHFDRIWESDDFSRPVPPEWF